MDMFLAKKLLAELVLPPSGPLLVALLGLAILGRWPRLGRGLAWLGLLSLTALSIPLVSHGLLRMVDKTPPLDLAQPNDAQAIVILGGGIRPDAPDYGGDTLGRLTLERVRYGALVARKARLPILVSGGKPKSARSTEAALMKRSLEEEFGVKVRWTETQSLNTHENAVQSARILRESGIRRVILVVHSFDLPRASAEFLAAGVQVIPAPTYIVSGTYDLLNLIPNANSLQNSYYATYEMLANAVRQAAIPAL